MQQTFGSTQVYMFYILNGFALLNDNYVPPKYSV